jgi:hypothetical protein
MHTLREGGAYGTGASLDPLKHSALSLQAVPQSSDQSYSQRHSNRNQQKSADIATNRRQLNSHFFSKSICQYVNILIELSSRNPSQVADRLHA